MIPVLPSPVTPQNPLPFPSLHHSKLEMSTSPSSWRRRCSPTSLSMSSALSHPLPSISPSSPSGSGKIPRALQVPTMGSRELFPHVFFFPLLPPGSTKLSRFSVPSAWVAVLTCPREKGAPTTATEWTDLVRTQGICPWRRRETLLLRNMIGREGITLGEAVPCNSGPRVSAASHRFAASLGERSAL